MRLKALGIALHVLTAVSNLIAADAQSISPVKREALYAGLDPSSIRQHLAFYELYPNTPEGQKSLETAWKLLSNAAGKRDFDKAAPIEFPKNIDAFIKLIQPLDRSKETSFTIRDDALVYIEELASNLPHKKIKGHSASTREELLQLESNDIDLARALLICQFESDPEIIRKIRTYEAALDLLALQVLARCPAHATSHEKVQALSHLLFFELRFRFPPHSEYPMDIDRFTFLPNVLESRRGVCLGVSSLYLCLAQRIGLDLEIITPPGHIFIRLNDNGKITNIETTLRGVHIETDEYLGINNLYFEPRPLKEVIGMAYFNEASIWLNTGRWERAIAAYKNALPFMPHDRNTKLLLAISLLLDGKLSEGKRVLLTIDRKKDPSIISEDALLDDIASGRVDAEGLKPLFSYVDETRESLIKKRDELIRVVAKWPRFRSGKFQLACTWLQLHRPAQAIELLKELHTQDPGDISIEYYLAQLCLGRYDYPSAWNHYETAEQIAQRHNAMPQALISLKAELSKTGPRP